MSKVDQEMYDSDEEAQQENDELNQGNWVKRN